MQYLIDSLFFYIGMAFITLSISKLLRLNKVLSDLAGLEKTLTLAIRILGFVYIVQSILIIYTVYFERVINGPYYPYLFGISYIFILTQLFWFKKLAQSYLFMFIAGFSFIIEFEKLIILLTSIHRDYIPTSWHYTSYFVDEIVGFLITIFVLFIINRFWIKNKDTSI